MQESSTAEDGESSRLLRLELSRRRRPASSTRVESRRHATASSEASQICTPRHASFLHRHVTPVQLFTALQCRSLLSVSSGSAEVLQFAIIDDICRGLVAKNKPLISTFLARLAWMEFNLRELFTTSLFIVTCLLRREADERRSMLLVRAEVDKKGLIAAARFLHDPPIVSSPGPSRLSAIITAARTCCSPADGLRDY